MAMTKCKECGQSISSKAETCPHCGSPLKAKASGPDGPRHYGCGTLLIVLVVIGVIASMVGEQSGSGSSSSATRSSEQRSSAESSREHLYADRTINIRSGPSTDHDVVGQVHDGESVIVDRNTEEWRKIQKGAHAGNYIYTPLLQPKQTASTSSNDKPDSVDNAYRLCSAFEGTNLLSAPCEVSGWDAAVDISIDTASSEARKICAGVVQMAREQGISFDSRWRLRIYSPYSGDNTIATCDLPG